MSHLDILEKHFNEKMKGVRATTFKDFKRDYKTLLEVIIASMQEVSSKTNVDNVMMSHGLTPKKEFDNDKPKDK